MPQLNAAARKVLAAAERGELFHSVYGGYDRIDLNTAGGGRVTSTVRRLLAADPPPIALRPRGPGDEHRGQQYRLTDAGRDALAAQP